MNSLKLATFKNILSIPSKTGYEFKVINWLKNYLNDLQVEFQIDDIGNIYTKKGNTSTYPLVMAHSDTVHEMVDMVINEEYKLNSFNVHKLALKAYRKDNGMPCGIGADDKSGIFICLQLLEMFENIKMFIPVREEPGCHGSHYAVSNHSEFFMDVDYAIMFDSPANSMSNSLMGINLYNYNSQFFKESKNYIIESGITKWEDHSYTDAIVIRNNFNIETLNLSAGYYKYHTKHEYVIIEEVESSISLGYNIIQNLNNKNYCKHYIN